MNLRIISKPQAHLKTIVNTSTCIKFQKNQDEIIRDITHKRNLLSIHFNGRIVQKMTKFKLQKRDKNISKPRPHLQTMVKISVISFKRIGIKL